MPNDSIKLIITPNGGSATTKTLQLARQGGRPDGACLFKSYDLAVDDQRHDLPIWSQTDWSGGMGDGVFTAPTRYAAGSTVDTSHYGQFFLGPLVTTAAVHGGAAFDGAIIDYAYFNSSLYLLTSSGYLHKWSTGDAHWDAVAGTGGSAATQLCVHENYLFIARGSGAAYQYVNTSDTVTAATMTEHHASGFLSAPSPTTTTSVLWKWGSTGGNNNALYSHDTGLNGTEWSRPAYIGDATESITQAFLHQNKILVGKQNALYHYDTDGKVYLLAPLDDPLRSYAVNFDSIAYLKGNTYFSMDLGLGELTANNVLSVIHPHTQFQELNTKQAICRGVAADDTSLYAMFYDGTDSVIYKGDEVNDERGYRYWSWCPWVTATSSYGLALHMIPSLSSGHPRLWFNIGSSVGTSRYVIVAKNPVATSFRYNDTPTFATSGDLYTGWIDLGHRDWYKLIDSVLAECRGTLAAGRTVTLYYEADEAGSWTAIDTAYSADTSGTKKYLDTAPVAAKKVRFKIALASNNSAYTPIVKYFAAYGSVKPDRVRMFDFTVLAEEGFSSRPETLRDFLIDGRDSRTLITMTDRFGTDHYVRILPGFPIEEEMVDEYGKSVGIAMSVRCEKVDWS